MKLLSALGDILSFAAFIVKRFFQRKDNPAIQYEKAKTDNARIIATGDADALNRDFSRGLPIDPSARGNQR